MVENRLVEEATVLKNVVAVAWLNHAAVSTVRFVVVALARVVSPVKVGATEKTKLPEPVSSPMRLASSLEVSIEVLDTLVSNLVQSDATSRPRAAEDADGTVQVCTSPEEVILKSVPDVELEKVCVEPVCPLSEVMPPPPTPVWSVPQENCPVVSSHRSFEVAEVSQSVSPAPVSLEAR